MPAHPRERSQASGVAKAQVGQVQQDLSAVGVDGGAHVFVGLVRRRGIEFPGEGDRGLSGPADAAAQGEHVRQPDRPWLLPARPGLTGGGAAGAVAHQCPPRVMRVGDRMSRLLTGRFCPPRCPGPGPNARPCAALGPEQDMSAEKEDKCWIGAPH
jgi:hypothetical protein